MTKVKICGITNLEDALASVRSGADALGFNFYDQSPRYIAPVRAVEIAARVAPEVETVGVFVNKSTKEVLRILERTGLTAAQFHGDESPREINEIRGKTNAKLIKAFRVGPDFSPRVVDDFDVDGILLDAFAPAAYGGTGMTFEWNIVSEMAKSFPTLYLAGGLSPDNVAEAIEVVRPYAVDVASGVESKPGAKDLGKLMAFIANAKSV